MRLVLAASVLLALAGTAFGQEGAMIHAVDENGAGYQFMPGTVTVAPGAEIVLMNVGSEPHKMTATNGAFESPTVEPSFGAEPGPASTAAFAAPMQAGEYSYFCPFHGEGMSGTLIVRESASGGQSATTPPTGAGGNDAPGVGLPAMGLVLVAAALLAARRR